VEELVLVPLSCVVVVEAPASRVVVVEPPPSAS
jgi:hypothetical protein